MRGFEFAWNDLGLAVFTTLAPAAALTYVVLALVLLLGRLPERQRTCLESWLIVPLAVATLGLIASATHLGTPSNALYVFTRTGRSPLSTEVLCAVLFLGTAGLYWLAGIYLKGGRAICVLRQAWLALSCVAAFGFLWGTTHAYDFWTVVTWDTPQARANIVLTGMASCAPLTLAIFVAAGQERRVRLSYCLLVASALAALAATAVMLLQNAGLPSLRNAYGTAADLVPTYGVVAVGYGAVQAAVLAGCLSALRAFWKAEPPAMRSFDAAGRTPAERRALGRLAVLAALSCLATFFVRFQFYQMHMTAGMV